MLSKPSQHSSYRQAVQKILSPLDIQINGNRPWDMIVYDQETYKRILSEGSLGLGESYINGGWDSLQLDEFFCKLTKDKPDIKTFNPRVIIPILASKLFNPQREGKSKRVIDQHYNLGNHFYTQMLDRNYMQYSCAYFKDTDNLDEAQKNKLELICGKLHLPKKGEGQTDRILEIGSGFGGFAKFATTNYNCEVTGYNISREQAAFSRELTKDLPVKIMELDYRDAIVSRNKESFNKVVSIGFWEHAGPKNYRTGMEIVDFCLKPEGLFLLQTIGRHNNHGKRFDSWINYRIFPGGCLPFASEILESSEGLFRLEDVHNFGHYYADTLGAWFKNFDSNWKQFKEENGEEFYKKLKVSFKDWPDFEKDEGEKFYRMWKYYLLSCKGAFESGSIDLYQFVFSKGNFSWLYEPVR